MQSAFQRPTIKLRIQLPASKMNENNKAIALSVTSLLLSIATAIAMFCCCYYWKKKKNSYEELDDEGYFQLVGDIERNRRTSNKRPSSILKFKGQPEPTVQAQGIQPNIQSQSGVNQTLGVQMNHAQVDGNLSEGTKRMSQEGNVSKGTRRMSQAVQSFLQETWQQVEGTLMDQSDKDKGKFGLGRIEFMFNYHTENENLMVKIIRATSLPPKDITGTSDPYVKVYILPEKKTKATSKIKRKNLNPRWNETFLFEGLNYKNLTERVLYIQVLDYDRFSRDDPIGELSLPLDSIDLVTTQSIWMDLQPCSGHRGKLGELLVSLCYDPNLGQLTVIIMKARDLKAKDINGYSDPYVKLWLLKHGRKELKRKTGIVEKELNPVYNESFIFDVPISEVRNVSLRISVMDYDTLGRNERIGEVLLGSRSGFTEVQHWNEMFKKSRQPVAKWHMLKHLD